MSREKRIPGPDHPIAVVENSSLIRVVTRDGGKVVAETTSAVTLTEAGYPAVHYIPPVDVDQALVERTDSHTYCPYKGEASYYSLVTPEKKIADAVWFHEEPFEAVGGDRRPRRLLPRARCDHLRGRLQLRAPRGGGAVSPSTRRSTPAPSPTPT